MKRFAWRLGAALLAVYLLTGFYVVGGNEKAVVRRFGRFVAPARSSGLHYDWPAPFSRVNRINFAAVRTVAVGGTLPRETNEPLSSPPTGSRALLTGDQNLLEVRGQVLYRPAEAEIGAFLFAQVSPEQRLAQLAEALLAELIAHSGVDFAHVRGLSELNERFTSRLRVAAQAQLLGVEIEQAVIEQVEPPLRVKAEFLDVSNARAEQARGIQESRTWAEQKVTQANSEQQRVIDGAEAERRARIAAARGSADRFGTLVGQMQAEAKRLGSDYADVRRLMVQRLSWQTLTEVWPKIRKKTIVDGNGPVDVSVFPKGP